MRDIFADDRLHERFWQLLDCADERDRIYVYRLQNDRPVRPALFKGMPFPELLDFLRDEHGGGKFQVMIRRGEQMLLTGRIGIIALPRASTRSTR